MISWALHHGLSLPLPQAERQCAATRERLQTKREAVNGKREAHKVAAAKEIVEAANAMCTALQVVALTLSLIASHVYGAFLQLPDRPVPDPESHPNTHPNPLGSPAARSNSPRLPLEARRWGGLPLGGMGPPGS